MASDPLSSHGTPLPRASVARPHTIHHAASWIATKLEPPQRMQHGDGFLLPAWWASTGGVTGGIAMALMATLVTDTFWNASAIVVAAWALCVIFAVMVLFWPFLLSFFCYLPLREHLQSRPRAAVYGAAWHLTAHSLVANALGVEILHPMLLIPLVVGGIWGSWLPAAFEPRTAVDRHLGRYGW